MTKPLFNKEYLEVVEKLPDFIEYTYWEQLQKRKIVLNEDIDFTLIERAIIQIINWNEEDESVSVEKRKPIEILLSSGGGDVIAGFALIDVIKNSKTPVHITAIGMAASMAALLLMSGHRRKALKNTTILIHDGQLGVHSTSKKAKQTMEYYDKLEERTNNFVLENTKISKELLDEKSSDEWYMFADEALELGIIDEIL
jgi:Protease subunit of ATP-dependent Clp proteases